MRIKVMYEAPNFKVTFELFEDGHVAMRLGVQVATGEDKVLEGSVSPEDFQRFEEVVGLVANAVVPYISYSKEDSSCAGVDLILGRVETPEGFEEVLRSEEERESMGIYVGNED